MTDEANPEPQPTAVRSELGTTRADEPIETMSESEATHQAELAHEAEIESGREQIGVTRGGQPIERLVSDGG